jgi:acyl-CoA thioesterase I
VLVLGDSISAAYGLGAGEGWVDRLAGHLDDCAIVNASISGETSEGGKARLPQLLESHQPAVLVLELGGNDGLRGFPLAITRSNLLTMIESAQAAGARVLLLGMRIPPNYGARYAEGFHALYAELAQATGSELVPFLLDGIATNPELMQQDGIHPTAEAQALIVGNVLPALQRIVRQ